MKKKRVWRYYCGFCKKSGCSSGHMKRHEEGCTRNPERQCGMCRVRGRGPRPTGYVATLVRSLGRGDEAGVAALRESAGGCPACMLAAIRQSGLQYKPDAEDPGAWVAFDFKKEKERFWMEVNDDRRASHPMEYL